jgi:uncharacterized protein YggU (UPF0235/DUF167 family)
MYIHIRAIPGAKKESLQVKSQDHFIVSVRESPERNMANRRIVEMVAEYFSVPVNTVRIINGHRTHSKLLSIDVC